MVGSHTFRVVPEIRKCSTWDKTAGNAEPGSLAVLLNICNSYMWSLAAHMGSLEQNRREFTWEKQIVLIIWYLEVVLILWNMEMVLILWNIETVLIVWFFCYSEIQRDLKYRHLCFYLITLSSHGVKTNSHWLSEFWRWFQIVENDYLCPGVPQSAYLFCRKQFIKSFSVFINQKENVKFLQLRER